VRCAEYIPALLLGEVNIGRGFIVQSVRSMRTILPGGETVETRAPGYTIRRDLFDQILARRAEEAGAEIWLSSRAAAKNDDIVQVKAGVIIGADGPRSMVGRWIGSANRNLIPAVQVSVELTSPMECTEIYFDREIYGGYGWLFPKGDRANAGIGRKKKDGTPYSLKECLDRFLRGLREEGKIKDGVSGNVAGWIPAERPRIITKENVLLTGDAAGHTHPITGAGIAQAVICGGMAGRWAARAVESGDLGLLAEYENEWRDLYGAAQERAFNRRQLLEEEWEYLDEIIRHCWVAFREYYAEP
jgi:flavin-dependent dehydrogenase